MLGTLHILRCCLIVLLLAAISKAQTSEQKTSKYMESIRRQPPLLLAFLREMPKGGDLHNHLSGAIYAEDLIDFAASDNLCVDRTSSHLIAPPCDSCEKYTSKPAIQHATAAPSSQAARSKCPVTATQPPTGARPSTAPSQRWQNGV